MNQNRLLRSCLGLMAGAALVPAIVAAQPTHTRVSGGALDSVSMRPLAGALVQLVSPDSPSRSRTATADESGGWAIDSVPLGTYLLGFLHPRLDSLNLPSPLVRVDAVTSNEIRVMLTIPSARTLVAQACGAAVAGDSLGLFKGHVRSARGTPLTAPARIRAQWLEITLGSRGIERRRPSQLVNADSSGAFTLCGVPSEGTFLVRAFAGSDSSGFVEFDAPRNGLLVRDLYVGAARKEPAPAGAATNEPLLRGTGALSGVVRSRTGEPVRGARLVLWGSGLEDTTETNGQYALQSLPSGSYTLEARALGFLPARSTVDVPEGNALATDVVLESFVPVMDTMRIRADRIAALNQLSDFERRRKAGGGYYVDEAQMARRSPMFMSDLLRTIPGVAIVGSSDRRDRIRMRGLAGMGDCTPSVYLNGMRAPVDDGDVEALVNPQTVRAVEVYTRTGNIPFELQVPNGCGVIVIWTGARSMIPSR